MSTVYEWNVYCDTEAAFVSVWSETEPTVCPNNNAHAIDGTKTYQLQRVSEQVFEVKEEEVPTGGAFQTITFPFDCAASTETTHNISWPMPVGVLSVDFNTKTDHEGDEISVTVAPDTTIGTLRADCAAASTVIPVSSTVTDNIKLGYLLSLDDGTNVDECGRVVAIDKTPAAETVTVETATVNGFLAATPTLVKMSVRMMHKYEIGPAGRYVLGESKIGASYIPANTVICVKYDNKTAQVKRFVPAVDILY